MTSPKIKCSPLVRAILEKISRAQTSSVQEVERSKLILLLLSGHSNRRIAQTTNYTWAKAKRWRDRWLSFEDCFSKVESREKKYHLENDLEKQVRQCLADAPRSGGPSRITAEQYCQILGVALEAPQASGRPVSQWSLNELVDEVKKRGIVSSISRSHLGAFLKGERSKTP